jgi:gamma-glutamylcysteine synthetase
MDASRELVWDRFAGRDSPIGYRCGIPPRAFTDAEDYFLYMAALPMIVRKVEAGVYDTPGIPFIEVLRAAGGAAADDEQLFRLLRKHWPMHEGSVWWSWRPRSFGTLEFRPACAQPRDEFLAASAFANGLVEAHDLLQEFADELHLPRDAWASFRVDAARRSVDAELGGRKALPLLTQVLEIAEEGLKRRREGEEAFLIPMWERHAHRTSPAKEARAAWEKGPESFRSYILGTAEPSEPWWRER